jgi:hypothetical protein
MPLVFPGVAIDLADVVAVEVRLKEVALRVDGGIDEP